MDKGVVELGEDAVDVGGDWVDGAVEVGVKRAVEVGDKPAVEVGDKLAAEEDNHHGNQEREGDGGARTYHWLGLGLWS